MYSVYRVETCDNCASQRTAIIRQDRYGVAKSASGFVLTGDRSDHPVNGVVFNCDREIYLPGPDERIVAGSEGLRSFMRIVRPPDVHVPRDDSFERLQQQTYTSPIDPRNYRFHNRSFLPLLSLSRHTLSLPCATSRVHRFFRMPFREGFRT